MSHVNFLYMVATFLPPEAVDVIDACVCVCFTFCLSVICDMAGAAVPAIEIISSWYLVRIHLQLECVRSICKLKEMPCASFLVHLNFNEWVNSTVIFRKCALLCVIEIQVDCECFLCAIFCINSSAIGSENHSVLIVQCVHFGKLRENKNGIQSNLN